MLDTPTGALSCCALSLTSSFAWLLSSAVVTIGGLPTSFSFCQTKHGVNDQQGQDNAPVGVSRKLGWASNVEMGGLGLVICGDHQWIANHSSTLLSQAELDVNDKGQENAPVGAWSELGGANTEMGGLGLGVRQASLDGLTRRWEHLVLKQWWQSTNNPPGCKDQMLPSPRWPIQARSAPQQEGCLVLGH